MYVLTRKLALIILGLMVLTPFQNCSAPLHSVENGSLASGAAGIPAGYTLQVDQALQTQAYAIIVNRCGTCHVSGSSGGITQMNDVNHLIAIGLVTPGDPTKGRLIGAIADGSMPVGGSVPATELQTLKDWITSMKLVATSGGGTVLPPVSTAPLPAGKTVADNSTLHTQAMTILNTYCAACHQGVSNGGVTNILDVKNLVATSLVTAGDPTKGRLIGAIMDNSMPAGTGARVTAADLQTLKNWISSITIVDDTGQPPLPTRVALAPTFTAVFANVIQPKCVDCHGPNLARGGIRLDSYTNVKNRLTNVISQCQGGGMPDAPYPVLTNAELTALTTWSNNGAANN